MYKIVQTKNFKTILPEVAAVPSSWVIEENKFVLWPNNKKMVSAYIKKYQPPGPNWNKYACKVLSSAGSFFSEMIYTKKI
jgi:hypothetical protein